MMFRYVYIAYLVTLIASIYPMHFIAYNNGFFTFDAMLLGWLSSLALTACAFMIGLCIVRSGFKTLAFTLLFTLLFWGFDPLAEFISGEADASMILIIALATAFIITGTLVYRLAAGNLARPEGRKLLGIFIHTLVLIPFTGLVMDALQQTPAVSPHAPQATQETARTNKPDLYYIILDGYGREDILRTKYNHDNASFTGFLREKGFYVADESHSNYGKTILSLTSSLNMDFLEAFPDITDAKGVDVHHTTAKRIKQNEVRNVLQSLGYTFVVVDSGYGSTSIKDADILLKIPAETLFTLEQVDFFYGMLDASPVALANHSREWKSIQRFLTQKLSAENPYAAKMVERFNTLRRAIDAPSPKFVFSHITAPHPPFVFKADDPLYRYKPNGAKRGSFGDGNTYTKNKPELISEYIKGYAAQIKYVNRQMEDFVTKLLASNPNSIIIIQGDHGPGAHLVWRSLEKTDLHERFSILNAYYFPGQDYRHLYPSITPVNSFRAVFNTFFSREYPLLPDYSYFIPFTDLRTLHEPVDITDRLKQPKADGK